MGYIRHHAIIVTRWSHDSLVDAQKKAIELGHAVSAIVRSVINGYESFLIAPDGSKEGWSESDDGDARRDKFIEWLENRRHGD